MGNKLFDRDEQNRTEQKAELVSVKFVLMGGFWLVGWWVVVRDSSAA